MDNEAEKRYIESVDGAAHQSAVEIIRSLEAEIEKLVFERDSAEDRLIVKDKRIKELEAENEKIVKDMKTLAAHYDVKRQRIKELEEQLRQSHLAYNTIFAKAAELERKLACDDVFAEQSTQLQAKEKEIERLLEQNTLLTACHSDLTRSIDAKDAEIDALKRRFKSYQNRVRTEYPRRP